MSTTTSSTLFAKIGGRDAVRAVVGIFYDKVLSDPILKDFFADTNMDRQRAHQTAFVSMAIGGPNEYKGRAMRPAHEGLGIEDMHFNAVATHLQASLLEAGVEEADVETIIATVGSLHDDVVGV